MRLPAAALLSCLLMSAADGPLQQVIEESKRLRQSRSITSRPDRFQASLRVWVESRLPQSIGSVLPDLMEELKRNGLTKGGSDFTPGFVTRLELIRPVEDRSKLVAIIGVTYGCGTLDTADVYDYKQGRGKRVFESHSTREHDEQLHDIQFSKPDGQLILTLRTAMQCGSSWNGLAYDLSRVSPRPAVILSGVHGIWFGNDPAYQVRLGSDELLMEITDRSIDSGLHNRMHVLRFRITDSAAQRVDPVALQPQDFVDEWLTRPWGEMESRTLPASRAALKKRHDAARTDSTYELVQKCSGKPGFWEIGLEESERLYFLVEETAPLQFRMIDIDSKRHPGCTGNSPPNLERPRSLFH